MPQLFLIQQLMEQLLNIKAYIPLKNCICIVYKKETNNLKLICPTRAQRKSAQGDLYSTGSRWASRWVCKALQGLPWVTNSLHLVHKAFWIPTYVYLDIKLYIWHQMGLDVCLLREYTYRQSHYIYSMYI